MANYFKRLDREKARGQDAGYQEYLLSNHTIFIGSRAREIDISAEALLRVTRYPNFEILPNVNHDPIPDEVWNSWEIDLAIRAMDEYFTGGLARQA